MPPPQKNSHRKKYHKIVLIGLILIGMHFNANGEAQVSGEIQDALTQKPLANARIHCGQNHMTTKQDGRFALQHQCNQLTVKRYGYARQKVTLHSKSVIIELQPQQPRALYLSFYGIGNSNLRNNVLELIEKTELNALVIDMKGDYGLIPYASSVPLAKEIDASRIITMKDPQHLINTLKAKGIYLIARIVVYKDSLLALAKTEWSIKNTDGKTWLDNESLAWTDPFQKEVWEYNINIAEEAAILGFDEIQFDYLRFPDKFKLQYSHPISESTRVEAITGFLTLANQRLSKYNIFISADIFGYVCWNLNDTYIGQRLDDLVPLLDYISPMLYPSSFQFGIPGGNQNPMEDIYDVVFKTLEIAKKRTGIHSQRFRPWLQAFNDYAFDRRKFGKREIMSQIEATENFGSNGWMLWNPRNIYSKDVFMSEKE